MIQPDEPKLSLVRQCELVGVSRSSFYFQPKGENSLNLKLMRMIDEQFLVTPFYGSRQMVRWLRRNNHPVSRNRVRRLMRKMGLMPIYQAPKTSLANSAHRIYPYLLRNRTIDQPNHVWCADITYIPMRHGFLYLIAIMDWASRKVLSWRLSNTMDASFCIEALQDALAKYGPPQIINTDQGSQFTGLQWTDAVKNCGAKISMDGKGRWMDNVFIERLWRSLKYECVYLNALETASQARAGIGDWINFYNTQRPHSTFFGRTPDEAYNGLDIQVTKPTAT
jgi:putative transposase